MSPNSTLEPTKRDALQLILDTSCDGIICTNSRYEVILFNRGAEELFGYSSSEMAGKPIEILIPERFRAAHRDYMKEFGQPSEATRYIGERGEIVALRKDGSEFPAEASISQSEINGEKVYAVILRDISRRKEIEDELKASLKEKELLLREVHHRVKNNLQIISSLLNLQKKASKTEEVRKAIEESMNRVRAIGLVHEMLYISADISEFNFQEYMRSLVHNVLSSYGCLGTIDCSVEIGHVPVTLDTAIQCGLIANELVSNCVKHAFTNGHKKRISLAIKQVDKSMAELRVSDNGVGVREGFDPYSVQTLGLRLIVSLAEQLGGDVSVENRGGAHFCVRFPVNGGDKL
ncbi:MAG: PAS domain S-box protein [Candidatus Dadabacteria bacterium]|nr:MAG: PAS domain S-box protein [Candidatus Dadabacteria bacterium]